MAGGRPHTTRVEHPEAGTAEVPTELLDFWAERGWQPAEFVPGDHTAAEVRQYLSEHPDETDRVLEAERLGQARKSLVGESSTADRSTSPAPQGADTASTKEGTK